MEPPAQWRLLPNTLKTDLTKPAPSAHPLLPYFRPIATKTSALLDDFVCSLTNRRNGENGISGDDAPHEGRFAMPKEGNKRAPGFGSPALKSVHPSTTTTRSVYGHCTTG